MAKKVYVGGATVRLANIVPSVTASGLNGWSINSKYQVSTLYPDQPQGHTTITVLNNDSSITGTYACYNLFSTISGNTSETRQVIYCQAKIRGSTNNTGLPRVYLRFYQNGDSTENYRNLTPIEGEGTNLNDGNWHTVYADAHTYNSNSGDYWDFDRIAFGIQPTNTANDIMDIKDVMIVNLTEGFGRNQEPSNSWCHDNLPYFEGTTKIFDTYHSNATSVANLVKKIYVGVNNTARKVKKGYIGVGGVARLWYRARMELSYYGTATSLSQGRGYGAGASVGDYAVITGGYTTSAQKTVDAYNKSLTRSTPTALPTSKYHHSGLSIGDYALFAGGYSSSDLQVYAYSSSLAVTTETSLSSARCDMGAACVGDYALFAGGCSGNSTTGLSAVDAYNKTLVHSTPTSLSTTRTSLAAASVGDYALFAGGRSGSNYRTTVNAYNTSLTRSTPTALTKAVFDLGGATADKYALFAGGYCSADGSSVNNVDVYNASLVKTTTTSLSLARRNIYGGSLDEYALFVCGGSTVAANGDVVDAYNGDLVRTIPTKLSQEKRFPMLANTGNYLIVAGGYYESSGRSSVVDVYQVT